MNTLAREKFLGLSIVALMSAANISMAQESDRLIRDMDGADYSIMTSLMVHRNDKSKSLCVENSYACIGVDRAELGLALIAGSRQQTAPKKLLGLMKYKFDGGLSSDYKCYLYERKDAVLKEVRNFDQNKAHSSCVSDFERAKRLSGEKFTLNASQICRTPGEINKEISALKRSLASENVGCDF